MERRHASVRARRMSSPPGPSQGASRSIKSCVTLKWSMDTPTIAGPTVIAVLKCGVWDFGEGALSQATERHQVALRISLRSAPLAQPMVSRAPRLTVKQ